MRRIISHSYIRVPCQGFGPWVGERDGDHEVWVVGLGFGVWGGLS